MMKPLPLIEKADRETMFQENKNAFCSKDTRSFDGETSFPNTTKELR
jgi:hypothetical protein